MGVMNRAGRAIAELIASMRGMEHAGPLRAASGHGISSAEWDAARRMIKGAPEAFVGDPVELLARQYPNELRDQALAIAADAGFQNVAPGRMMIAAAHPTRNVLFDLGSGDAAGRAYRHAGRRPGLIELAAGPELDDIGPALLHEARHVIENPGLSAALEPLDEAYMDAWQALKNARGRARPAEFDYLASPGEEMARLGDVRANYAQRTGRLIEDADDAEDAMRLMAAGAMQVGLHPNERQFYDIARRASPSVRDRQNWLLQSLLAAPVAVGVGAASMGGDE